VGLTEQQARDAGVDVAVAVTTVPSSTRGWIHKAGNDGVIKLVADRARVYSWGRQPPDLPAARSSAC
jgi:pyruvate/2-oxoglutarate dehydrogenase complex dihydrolipoamide dehydrogenase (E3) component